MSTKRPPVEPLSRPAWDRVEAGVFARLDRGEHLIASVEAVPTPIHARRWLMAGVFAAAASVALWWQVDSTNEPAPVAEQVQPAAPAVARHEARIVSTDAPTETTLGEARITLAAHSDVSVAGSDAEGWLVRLATGEVDCTVAPRLGRPPFVVQAGLTKVSVVGTRFTVARTGAGARVDVTEGQVQVDSAEHHVLLGPGDSWPKAEPEVPAEAEPEAPADTEDLDDQPRGKSSSLSPSRVQQRFERAARLEAKNPAAALAIYQKLARGKGPWAANALYAQARLELERGRPERAKSLLSRYLDRHPRGLNATDVRNLLDRIEKSE